MHINFVEFVAMYIAGFENLYDSVGVPLEPDEHCRGS